MSSNDNHTPFGIEDKVLTTPFLSHALFMCLCLFSILGQALHANTSPKEQVQVLNKEYADILANKDVDEQRSRLVTLITKYESLAKQVSASAHLHYNLGTLHLKLENYGPAIFHLKSAYRMNSDDTRIANHLQRASRQAKVALEPQGEKSFDAWTHGLWQAIPASVWGFLAMALALVTTALSFLQKRIKPIIVTCLCLSLSAFVLAELRDDQMGISKEAVLQSNYNPHSGMGPSYPGIMSGEGLKAGNMGKVIRQESGWLEVQWYDAKRGWVPREVVLCIDEN
jgi:tetratricopeptide (TPR) repeat protein